MDSPAFFPTRIGEWASASHAHCDSYLACAYHPFLSPILDSNPIFLLNLKNIRPRYCDLKTTFVWQELDGVKCCQSSIIKSAGYSVSSGIQKGHGATYH